MADDRRQIAQAETEVGEPVGKQLVDCWPGAAQKVPLDLDAVCLEFFLQQASQVHHRDV